MYIYIWDGYDFMAMRRIKFESGRDTHFSMEDILDVIDQRVTTLSPRLQEGDPLPIENEIVPYTNYGQPMIGGSQSGFPTLSQEYLHFVDGTDEVPEWIKKKYWGIITRMNQLTQIGSEKELARVEASIRAMIRPFIWKTKVSSEEMFMIQHYTKTQVLKAFRGTERRLIAPQLQEITRNEIVTEGSLLSRQNQNPGMVRNAINSVFGR